MQCASIVHAKSSNSEKDKCALRMTSTYGNPPSAVTAQQLEVEVTSQKPCQIIDAATLPKEDKYNAK